MNIILLSGGSGKRLWPLSNDARAKQFLKIFQNEDGQYESMVQRIYRQIGAAGIDANIIIATTETQVDSIKSQLGEQVTIVTEPERRNTYPAISLAAVYLYKEQGLSREEPVLVLPIDPYADDMYFETLCNMEMAVKSNISDIVLMGITPTYPSEKYGYILPRGEKEINTNIEMKDYPFPIYPVASFMEKPTLKKAEELIQAGAFWNGGVFGFQLGYLLDIIEKTVPIIDYSKTKEAFSQLENMSFDFKVAEQSDSITMLPYLGNWKDLGTWNTLSEHIAEDKIGNVMIGEEAANTTVVNELNIPIVVLGTKDIIVAASADGILVSDKHKSSYIKPYVEDLGNRPMYEERRWGDYRVLDYVQYSDEKKSLTKHLTLYQGKAISYQKHNNRDEIWTIVDGVGQVIVDDKVRNVKRGDVVYIVAGQKHAMRAQSDLHLIEVQIGAVLEEYDIERFDWNWE